MSDVDIVLNVAVQNIDKIYNLSNSLQQLNRTVNGALNPIKNLDARSRALSAAVGATDSSLKNHAKTISQLAANNTVLTNEMNRVKKEIQGLGTSYRFAAGASSEFRKIAVSDLKAYEASLKSIRLRALVEDLKSVSQEQKRLGKDAQFVGRSLIIGLTTPIMGFARYGLQSLVAIDKEFVRLNKVLENVAPNLDSAAKKMGVDLASATAEQNKQLNSLVSNYEYLNKELSAISTKFGLSKSLTVGLAGDYAELGIQTTKNIALITELTAKTEKLGNMDIGAAKDLVQSLYFQAQRAFQQTPAGQKMTFQERELASIKAATAQLNLFNAVENVTALTLRDLGDAFPEVAASATSFGLSMTEAAALLAPMKAAGFETGASANSIKVSLQRLTAPTKQNSDLFKELTRQYNVNFEAIKGTGVDALQQLVDGFNTLRDSAAGQEGAMEFFSKVFGVRQGPRMEVAVSQLATFDRLLKDSSASTSLAEKQLQAFANGAVRSANRATNANLPLINSIMDIGIIARAATATAGQAVEGLTTSITAEQIAAAKKVREEVGKEIVKAQRESGQDLIGQVGTEAGRAMFIELAGASNASQVAQRELEAALGSLDVQLSILKNNFKSFAADLIKGLKPAFEKISDISTKLYNSWNNLDAQTKKLISTVTLVIAGATAAIGPLIFVFGQFRLAMGSVGKVLLGFLPGLKTMSIESLAAREGLLKLTKPLTVMGDTVVNTNSKFATFIATLSSGNGPVSKMATKLGELTGVMQKTTTAPVALTRSVYSRKGDTGIMSGLAPTLGPAGTRIKPSELLLRRTAAGIIDPTDPTARIPRALRKAFAEEEFSMEQAGLRRGGASGTRYTIQQRAGLIRRTMGYRSISAADVGEAINLRQKAFEAAGIDRTSPSASLGGGILRRRGREISEERALTIARGGIKGRVLGAIDTAGARAEATSGAIRALPTKAVDSYKNALTASKAAQKALTVETLAFTGTGPSKFALMRSSVMGFAKSFSLVNNAIKLTKITLIASGIGVLLLAIGVAVMLVMKNMDKFKEAGASGFKTIKNVLNILKKTFESLVRPIVDLFASFGNGADGAEGAISGIGKAFNVLTKVLEFVAKMFQWLVENIIQPYLYGIVNLVKFVVNIFQGKWGDALKALGAAFGNVFAGVVKLGITLMGFLVKQIVNLVFEIPSAFMKAWAWGIERATDLFFGFVEWVLGQVKRIPVLGRFLGGVGDAALGGLRTARDAYLGVVRGVANGVNAAGDTLKRGIDSITDKAKGAVDKLAKGGVKKSKGKLDLFGGKDDNSVEVDTDDAQEAITNATGTGIEEGGEEGIKKLTQRFKDIKKELQEEIANRIKDTMNGVVDTIQNILKDQKEASLSIYDNQIKAIEDVGKAEGRLTKEQEYQNKLREAEAERSLNRINNRRSYAMAVYAGNIDEARAIADQGARQEVIDNEKIDEINRDRAKEVADQNRADLIDSIKESKKAASDYFDSMIKSFSDAAKKITEFPPTTAEEFNAMLNKLIEGGDGFIGARAIANSMGTTFSQSFSGALSQLGVNASGPLTSALQKIGETLTSNNPFGPEGIWNKTIDASIDALTRKYTGLSNTLTTIIDTKSDSFKRLFEIYNRYQNLIETPSGTGTGTTTPPGNTGTNNDGVLTGNRTSIAAANADLAKIRQYSDKYLQDKYGGTAEGRAMIASIKSVVGSIASSAVLLGGHDEGLKDFMPVVTASKYKDQIRTNSELVYAYIVNNRRLFLKGSGAAGRTDESGRSGFFKGGMPYGMGGPTKGPIQQGIPAILHGGEYVVRNSAVKKYGWGMMQQINQGTYKPKPYAIGGEVSGAQRIDYGDSRIGDKYYDKYLDFYESLNYPGVQNDPALKEFRWQVRNGGFNLRMMREIWARESRNWKNRGQYGRGGLGFNPAGNVQPWIEYGGFDSFGIKTADLATPYQQMVIYNRMFAMGYSGKDKRKEPLPTDKLASYIAMGANPMMLNKFGNAKFFEGMTRYWQDKPKSISRIVSPQDGIMYVRTGSSGARPLVDPNNVFGINNKGQKFYYSDTRDESYTPLQYAIGGLVKGSRRKSAADFRKAEIDSIYKFNYKSMMDQTSERIKAMKATGYDVANQRKVLNPFSDLAYKPENQKSSIWDKTIGKGVTGITNLAKIASSGLISGVSFVPEFGIAFGSTLLGKLGLGEEQNKNKRSLLKQFMTNPFNKESMFNQMIATPFMQTSFGQMLKATKELATTGKDYREVMGLDRGPFGLAGFLPTSYSERAMQNAAANRAILGKQTMISPGGLLGYYGLEKTGLAREGTTPYMATVMGGDIASLLALNPNIKLTNIPKNIKSAPSKLRSMSNKIKTLPFNQRIGSEFRDLKDILRNKQEPFVSRNLETNAPIFGTRNIVIDAYSRRNQAFTDWLNSRNSQIMLGRNADDVVMRDIFKGRSILKGATKFYERGINNYTGEFSLSRAVKDTILLPFYQLRNIANSKSSKIRKLDSEYEDVKYFIKNIKTAPRDWYDLEHFSPYAVGYRSSTRKFLAETYGKMALRTPISTRISNKIKSLKNSFYDLLAEPVSFKGNMKGLFTTGAARELSPENQIVLNKIANLAERKNEIKQRIQLMKEGYYSNFKYQGLVDQFKDVPKPVLNQIEMMMSGKTIPQLSKMMSDNFGIKMTFTPTTALGSGEESGIGSYKIYTMRKATKPSDKKYFFNDPSFSPEKSVFATSDFSFDIRNWSDGEKTMSIGGLYSIPDFNQVDISKLLAFVYTDIIKKHGVTKVVNSSYSKYSYALSDRLSSMMEFLDPDVKVITPPLANWSPNSINFTPALGVNWRFQSIAEKEKFFNEENVIKNIFSQIKLKGAEKAILKASKEAKKAGRVPKSPSEWEQAYLELHKADRFKQNLSYVSYALRNGYSFGEIMSSISPDVRAFLTSPAGMIYYRTLRNISRAADNAQELTQNQLLAANAQYLPPGSNARFLPPGFRNPNTIPLDIVYNGGLIPQRAIGGLVKGKKTSAADFRKVESQYSQFDIQTMAYLAQKNIDKGKKGLFKRAVSAVTSPISNFFKDKLTENLYGYNTGQGITGGAATLQRIEQGKISGEGPGVLSMPSVQAGAMMAKTMTEFMPISGAFFPLMRASEPERNNKSKMLQYLQAGLNLVGPTTVFAPNSGYMTMAPKLKTLANLDKIENVSSLRNIEQFFPGTRIPMPAGLTPTLSEETGRVLNEIKASASWHRKSPGLWRGYGIERRPILDQRRGRLIDSLVGKTIANPNSESSKFIQNVLKNITPHLDDELPSKFNATIFDFQDIRNFFPDMKDTELLIAKLSDIKNYQILNDTGEFDKFTHFSLADYEKLFESIKSGNPNGRFESALTQSRIRKKVLGNIYESMAIRLNIPKNQVEKIFNEKTKLMVANFGNDSYEIDMWRQLKGNEFGKSVNFRFDLNTPSPYSTLPQNAKALYVGYLGKSDNVSGSVDLLRVMSYVYDTIIKPQNIKDIVPGSTSPYSFTLAHKMNEIMQFIDPDIKIHIPSVDDYLSGRGGHNAIDFTSEDYLMKAEEPWIRQSYNYAQDMLSTPQQKIKLYESTKRIKNAMKMARRGAVVDQRGVEVPNRSEIFAWLRGLSNPNSSRWPRQNFIGGLIPQFANGGFVPNFASQGVPAMLHGGEYVINSNAVRNLGISALQAINDMRFNTPKAPSYAGGVQPQTSSTSTVHIYVDNFIGEKAWFESMMKDYNINVGPQNQKAAGLNNTTISTYRGINRGL